MSRLFIIVCLSEALPVLPRQAEKAFGEPGHTKATVQRTYRMGPISGKDGM